MTMILPEGFTSRPARLDDTKVVAGLINTCAIQRTGQVEVGATGLGSEWQSPGFCMETDTRLLYASDGRLVACAMLWDRAPHVVLRARAEVHPDARGRGLGAALCHWLEERGRQALPKAPPGTRVALHQQVLNTDTVAQDLLRWHGYTLARTEFRMLIELDDLPPAEAAPPHSVLGHGVRPSPPPGIVLRPFVPDRELGALLSVMRQAFHGHWGYAERSLEEDLSEYQHLLDTVPNVDPSLWFVAEARMGSPVPEGTEASRDGQPGTPHRCASKQIVGTCLAHPAMVGDPELAYIWGLGVLRPWRRRGVGLALLQHTFHALGQRGKRRVTLTVDAGADPDAGIPNGATRLYEKAGMHVQRQALFFEKELRPGREVQ